MKISYLVMLHLSAYYSSGGPINVITAIHPPRLLPHWLTAGQELGFKVADANGHQTQCMGKFRINKYLLHIKTVENSTYIFCSFYSNDVINGWR